MSRKSTGSKCLHCNQLFVPDFRNRHHQRYCAKADCRRVSKQQSQRRWLEKPANRDYFRGPDNTARVQAWRQQHPGYWKRSQKSTPPLQEVCPVQPSEVQPIPQSRDLLPLQDLCLAQPPLLVGLISSFIGSPLQEDIVGHLRHLIAKGREILGPDAQGLCAKP